MRDFEFIIYSHLKGKLRLHSGFDMFVLDGRSITMMWQQVRDVYEGKVGEVVQPSVSFRDCIIFKNTN